MSGPETGGEGGRGGGLGGVDEMDSFGMGDGNEKFVISAAHCHRLVAVREHAKDQHGDVSVPLLTTPFHSSSTPVT